MANFLPNNSSTTSWARPTASSDLPLLRLLEYFQGAAGRCCARHSQASLPLHISTTTPVLTISNSFPFRLPNCLRSTVPKLQTPPRPSKHTSHPTASTPTMSFFTSWALWQQMTFVSPSPARPKHHPDRPPGPRGRHSPHVHHRLPKSLLNHPRDAQTSPTRRGDAHALRYTATHRRDARWGGYTVWREGYAERGRG